MRRSSPTARIAVLLFAGVVSAGIAGCTTTASQDDEPTTSAATPPSASTNDSKPAPSTGTSPADDDDTIGAVTLTVTYPDGRQQTQAWGFAGGGNVNGITNLAFKPDATTLVPNVGIMLMRPVTSGDSFRLGAGDGTPEGTATLLLDAKDGYQLASGTLTLSRVEQLTPGAVEVDGVLRGECISMMRPGDTVVVELTFRGAIIAS